MSRNAFFSSRSERKHFLWRWYCRKKHKNVKYRGLYSYRQRVRVITLFPNIFSYCFCMLSDFAKVFERKVWRVQVAHLHNAARALSSPSRCFQLTTNLGKISFVIFDIVIIKTNRMWFTVALVKFHWFGINWHVFIQSECRNCCLYVIRKSRHKQNLENISKYGFSPDLGGKNGGVLSMRMQVILDSSFARSGSVPIWGGKKGEFRDWTRLRSKKKT